MVRESVVAARSLLHSLRASRRTSYHRRAYPTLWYCLVYTVQQYAPTSKRDFAASNFKPAQKVVAPRRLDTHRWIVLPASGVANAEDLHTIMLPRRATDREKERMIATGILGIAFLAFSCCRRPPTRLRRISYRNNAFLSGVDVLEPERMLVCCGRSTQRNAWCLTSL